MGCSPGLNPKGRWQKANWGLLTVGVVWVAGSCSCHKGLSPPTVSQDKAWFLKAAFGSHFVIRRETYTGKNKYNGNNTQMDLYTKHSVPQKATKLTNGPWNSCINARTGGIRMILAKQRICELVLPDFKTDHEGAVNKSVWYWLRKKQINWGWGEPGNPNTSPGTT